MWTAKLKNGQIVSETTHKWSEVKERIDRLSYIYNGTTVNLPPSSEYIQIKSASASLTGGEIEVESQTVGFKVGDKKILLRFNFKDNKIETIIE